jgi:hypothetical protein
LIASVAGTRSFSRDVPALAPVGSQLVSLWERLQPRLDHPLPFDRG